MYDILTIGTATRDVFVTSTFFKVLRDPKHLGALGFETGEAQCFALGAKIEIKKPTFAVGGGAVNTAVTFSRQGFKTASVVKIGDDDVGEKIIETFKKERVSPLTSKDRREGIGTSWSCVLLSPEGERTILNYRGASDYFEKRDIPFSKIKARWAYIVPGSIAPPLLESMVAHFKKQGTRIAMNPSRSYLALGMAKLKSVFQKLDVVVMNREEAAFFTGVEYKNQRRIFKTIDALIPGIAVVTDGAGGALVSDGSYLYRAGIFKEKKLVDRTGAGDAFGSGFVAGLMLKEDIHYALRLASANATSVVEYIGAEEGILTKKAFAEKRWKYLDLDVEPL